MAATAGYQAGIETNSVQLSYAQEANWGELPAAPFKAIRMTGEGLRGQKQRQRPDEIDTSGQASAAITTQESADGTINFALSYGTYDDLLAGVLGEDWTAPLAIDGASGDIATVAAGNKLTSTTAGKFAAVQVGQWIRLFGFNANSGANNGFYRVAAKNGAADELTLAGKTVTNETPSGANAKIRGSMLRNGTVFKSFFFQKMLAPALWLRYPGVFLSGATLTGGVGQFFNGTFTTMAKEEAKATADASTGAIVPAPLGRVHDTVAGFQALQLDDAAIGAVVESVSLNITRQGAAASYGLGSPAAQGIVPGKLQVDGSLRTYFRDFTLYERFKTETGGRIAYRTLDDTGAGYIVTILNATIMNPQIVAGGPNQPIMAEFQVEANPDPVTGRTLQIDRFAATA